MRKKALIKNKPSTITNNLFYEEGDFQINLNNNSFRKYRKERA